MRKDIAVWWRSTIASISMTLCLSLPSRAAEACLPQTVRAVGQTQTRLQLAWDRLCAPPLDDLDFVLADVSLNMARRFTNYSGDISGRMLGALAATGPALGSSTRLFAGLESALPQYQRPDGHFGTDQDLGNLVQVRDMPILWGNGRLLLALAEQCGRRPGRRPDPVLLAVATRLGDYIISTRPYYGKKENFQRVGGVAASGYTTCYPSLVDGLVALGEVTGETKFYDEARFIARLSLLDQGFRKHHSHGRLVTYRGMLDLDRLTGTPEFLAPVKAGCQRIAQEFLFPTGGVPEYFDRSYNRDEGCSEADWIRVNFLLWRATGRTTYLDMAEHVLRNHMLPMQYANGGFGHGLFRVLKDGDDTYRWAGISNIGSDSYWCCSMHCTQVLADTVNWAVLARDGRLLITWLAEARSSFGSDELDAGQVTAVVRQTAPTSWTVSLEAAVPTEVPLRLRVPGWADAITVDGEEFTAENGWVDLVRKCSPATSIRVTMPDEIRLAGVYAPELVYDSQPEDQQPARIFAGADLYCLPDASIVEGLLSEDAVPAITLAATKAVDGRISAIIYGRDSETQSVTLVPMIHRPRGGARYIFRVRRVDADAFAELASSAAEQPTPGTFVELEFTCDGEFEVYLNGKMLRGRSRGGDEAPQIEAFTTTTPNVVAVKIRSDAERPGFIGTIRIQGRKHVTAPDAWSAVPCPEELTAEWLTDWRDEPQTGAAELAELLDLGEFGAAPWKHMCGEFLDSGARWIWPDVPSAQSKRWWLLRCRFE